MKQTIKTLQYERLYSWRNFKVFINHENDVEVFKLFSFSLRYKKVAEFENCTFDMIQTNEGVFYGVRPR